MSARVQGGILRMFSKDDGWLMLENGDEQATQFCSPRSITIRGASGRRSRCQRRLSGASINVMSSHRVPVKSGSQARWPAHRTGPSSRATPLASGRCGTPRRLVASILRGPLSASFPPSSRLATRCLGIWDIRDPVSGVENALPYILHFDGARWTPIPVVSPVARSQPSCSGRRSCHNPMDASSRWAR